ncbi:ImmA/IrrE family metallo-endopeptidase [Oscillibacter sp. GMB15532]|uniref:ImmA/IrrE family metallo-endopeptidase n=1 Tax=Oscillibacter sp. GMB15532 TaxID=3230022 RepID=UPI0034DFD817
MTPEQCAAQVLSDFSITDIPILHFPHICEKRGIKWDEYPYNDAKYSGALHKIDGEYYILINSDCGIPTRINFTKAHELGHFFLKHPGEKFECSSNDIFTTDIANKPSEVEANRFAAAFLLPQDKMELLVSDDNYDFTTISGIASSYAVSIQTTVIRTITFLQGSFRAVWAVNGIVQWAIKSPHCKQPTLYKGQPLPPQSIAHKCFADNYIPPKDEYIKVPHGTWGHAKTPPTELVIPFKKINAILSITKW